MDIQIAHLQSFWKEAQTRKSSIHGHGKIRHSSKGVKSNVHFPKSCQKSVKADIALVFPLPPPGDRHESVRTVEVGHGRVETRQLTTSEAVVGYRAGPGMAHVCELGRHVITKKTGKERVEVVYGVTSVRPERATPRRRLELVRGHGQIEHMSHWVRDVRFDEDRAQVRGGNTPKSWRRYAIP